MNAETLSFIKRWLTAVSLMIVIMVTIGGITRLTGSGLSITDWKPIMGAIPPLSQQDWSDAFQRYQESPQYLKVNHGMSLSEFKWIFFWEYVHRLWGRLIGLAYALPFFWLLARRRVRGALAGKLAIGLALGGLQGVVGWLMVKSGLVDLPRVSHYRLAIHFNLALFVLIYLLKLRWSLGTERVEVRPEHAGLWRTSKALVALLLLQLLYGAFVAGLKAGWIHNTFPTMSGEWFPSAFWALSPAFLNFLENPTAIQWIHRWVGAALALLALWLWRALRRVKTERAQRVGGMATSHSILTQFLIGVLTVLWAVPVVLGVLHQLMACVVLIAVFYFQHTLTHRVTRAD